MKRFDFQKLEVYKKALQCRCLAPEELLDRGLDILFQVVSMLTRMVRNRMEQGKGKGR